MGQYSYSDESDEHTVFSNRSHWGFHDGLPPGSKHPQIRRRLSKQLERAHSWGIKDILFGTSRKFNHKGVVIPFGHYLRSRLWTYFSTLMEFVSRPKVWLKLLVIGRLLGLCVYFTCDHFCLAVKVCSNVVRGAT